MAVAGRHPFNTRHRGPGVDAEDFLDADELAAMRRGVAAPGPGKDACDGCRIALTWVDPSFVCDDCTWCPDCAEAAAMVCSSCSSEMRPRPPRAKALPRA